MKPAHIIWLILIMASCSQSPRHTTDYSIAPKFVTTQPTFCENARLVLNNADTLSAMIVDATEEQALEQFFTPINQRQAIVVKYDEERRRAYTMSNIGQSIDIVFLNSEKNVINTMQNMRPYSTQTFNSFEYAQYAIILAAGNYGKKNIKECDIVKFLPIN